MVSMGLPSHSSGVSRIVVSPYWAGTIGPIETFGYPSLPTKTPGGDDPEMTSEYAPSPTLAMDCAFTMIGQRGLPQSSFAPLQRRHIQAGGFSTTSIDLAALSSKPMASADITLESHVILEGS